MKREILSSTLALTMVLSLAGCGGQSKTVDTSANSAQTTVTTNSTTTAENQVIKYWYPWGGDSETWDLWRISEFETNNPGYKIDATYVPPDSGITNGKLLAAIAAKSVPDVICAANTLVYPLAAQGAFVDVTDNMAKLKRTPADYQQSVQNLMDIDGKWYIMPMETDTTMLFINNTKAKEGGLDPTNPPKTVSELDTWSEAMTKTDGKDIKTMGFIPWIDGGEETFNYAWAFGAPLYDAATNKLNLTDDNFANIFEWEAKYAKKYNPESIKSFAAGFGGAFSPDHAFFSGKVAMTINGNWFNNAIKNYAKDLDFSIAPLPVNDNVKNLYGGSPLAVNTYACPKDAKNVDGACLFVDYIANAKIADDNNKTWYSTPTRKDVIDELTLVKEKDVQYSVIKGLVFNPNSNTPALVSIRNVLQEEILSLRDRVLYEGKEPRALLKDLQAKMETELQKTK